MTPPRILFTSGIFPPDPGGPATYVPRMAAALAKEHHVVGVITLSDAQHDDSAYPFRVVRIPRPMNRVLRMLRTIRTIRALAKDADVVYANGIVLETVLACCVFGRKPVVVKVVGDLIWERAQVAKATTLTIDEFQTAPHSRKTRLLRALQGWYTSRAALVITPSEYLARIVAGWGVPRERVRVVYNATEAQIEAPAPSPRFDVVTVARLVPWKGLTALIALATRRGWSLNIVGDGPQRGELEALAAGNPRIRFAGHLPSSRVRDELRSARVFVLNSSYEGLPHVVLEAQAAGVPVVATNVGGTGEAVQDGRSGLLVPYGDDAALEKAIDSLLGSESLRHELVNSAAEALRSRFSADTMLARTSDALREAARTGC